MAPRKPVVVSNNTTGDLAPADTLMGAGWHNKLRNGNAAVNARGVSGTVTLAAGAYGHDGWKGGANGATYTFSTSGPDTVISLSAGSLLQTVPASDIEGTAYAASWAGTATGRVYQGSASGSYAASPLAASGLTAATATTLELTGGTFTAAQLEYGTTPTGFERRPLAAERAVCAQFFQVVGYTIDLWCGDGAAYGVPVSWAPMRTTPAASLGCSSSSNCASGYPYLSLTSGVAGTSGTVKMAASASSGTHVTATVAITLSCDP